MTLNLDLSDSDGKVDHAVDRLAELKREMPTRIEQHHPYAVRFSEVDPQTGWCEVSLVPQGTKPALGHIFGDVVTSLRSALDYIVIALVEATPGAGLTKKHQFPIFACAAGYRRWVGTPGQLPLPKSYLGGLSDGVALIEQLQPYHHKPNSRHDPLFHVWRFSNANKHRQPIRLMCVPKGTMDIRFSGTKVEDDHIADVPDWTPNKEFLIHRMRFDPPVAQNMRAVGPLSLQVIFYVDAFEGDPPLGIDYPVLREACDHVRMVVDAFKLL